ncbi:tubulin epsilon and delta complex protein 1 isoform X1 [Lepisosteus oculatus]|uniref:Tubulin epsilon and delta complex 1 n=1 Tax=Lepisosteus oculatus TaxID=7918 RepID=W5N9U5_LEPOC|nr:PREDICTED: uncharacterized protein C14orf80 homolog isoform X1 [Lepisosteus oculatus]
MQRERNVNMKEVIGSLCYLLSRLGVDSVPSPEAFRRAKFGKADGTVEFWRFLHSLLEREVSLGCDCTALQESHIERQVSVVQSALWHCGYGALEFYQLPTDGSQGSRELLLAFSWLLSRAGLLEHLLEKSCLRLEDITPPSVLPLSVCADGDLPVSAEVAEGLESSVRHLQWQQGRLRLHWKTVQASREERAILLHKIHSYTKGCQIIPTVSHLSAMETNFIKDPMEQNRILKMLQSEIALLESYLEWKRLEPLYWCWMDSVIDAKLADPLKSQGAFHKDVVAMTPKVKKINKNCCQGNMEMREINQLSKVLMELNVGIQEALSAKRATWCLLQMEKKCPDALNSSVEFGDTFANLQEKVRQKLCALRTHGVQNKCFKDTTFRLVLREHQPQQPFSEKAVQSGELPASQAIKALQEMEADFQAELCELQQACRNEILENVGRLEGMIFIPPMKK